MNDLKKCSNGGHFGGTGLHYPEREWEYDYGGLFPRVACSNLICGACGEKVCKIDGFAHAETVVDTRAFFEQVKAGVIPDNLSEDPSARTYTCGCTTLTAYGTTSVREAVESITFQPKVAWTCGGHPELRFPETLDGIPLGDVQAIPELVKRAVEEGPPSGWCPEGFHLQRHPAAWLAYVVAHSTPSSWAGAVVSEVARIANQHDPVAQRFAVSFFRWNPSKIGADTLGSILKNRLELEGIESSSTDDETNEQLQRELEECTTFLLGLNLSEELEDTAKMLILAGSATDEYYFAIGQTSPEWLVEHGKEILDSPTPAYEAMRLRLSVEDASDVIQTAIERVIKEFDSSL